MRIFFLTFLFFIFLQIGIGQNNQHIEWIIPLEYSHYVNNSTWSFETSKYTFFYNSEETVKFTSGSNDLVRFPFPLERYTLYNGTDSLLLTYQGEQGLNIINPNGELLKETFYDAVDEYSNTILRGVDYDTDSTYYFKLDATSKFLVSISNDYNKLTHEHDDFFVLSYYKEEEGYTSKVYQWNGDLLFEKKGIQLVPINEHLPIFKFKVDAENAPYRAGLIHVDGTTLLQSKWDLNLFLDFDCTPLGKVWELTGGGKILVDEQGKVVKEYPTSITKELGPVLQDFSCSPEQKERFSVKFLNSQTVLPCEFIKIKLEEEAQILQLDTKSKTYYYDSNGNLLKEAYKNRVKYLGDAYFLMQKPAGCGVEDVEGKEIIPFVHSPHGSFNECHCLKETIDQKEVFLMFDGENNLTVYGNQGQILFKIEDQIGHAHYIDLSKHIAIKNKFDKFGILSLSGEIVLPFEYEFIYNGNHYGDYRNVILKKDKNEYYLYDIKSTTLDNTSYENLWFIDKNTIAAKKDGKYGSFKINYKN